jgi:hypothetical protein
MPVFRHNSLLASSFVAVIATWGCGTAHNADATDAGVVADSGAQDASRDAEPDSASDAGPTTGLASPTDWSEYALTSDGGTWQIIANGQGVTPPTHIVHTTTWTSQTAGVALDVTVDGQDFHWGDDGTATKTRMEYSMGRTASAASLDTGIDASGGNEGETTAYRWQTLLPTDNGLVTSWYNMLVQWHAPGPGDQPPLGIVWDAGDYAVHVHGGVSTAPSTAKFDLGPAQVGVWNDFIVRVHWSSTAAGSLDVWQRTATNAGASGAAIVWGPWVHKVDSSLGAASSSCVWAAGSSCAGGSIADIYSDVLSPVAQKPGNYFKQGLYRGFGSKGSAGYSRVIHDGAIAAATVDEVCAFDPVTTCGF